MPRNPRDGLEASTLNRRKKHEPETKKATYQATASERCALGRHISRLEGAAPAPRLKVVKDGKSATISLDHPDSSVALKLFMEALGTADCDFTEGLLHQLTYLNSGNKEINEGQLHFMLAVVKGIRPKDHLEAMLAVQMAVVHLKTLQSAKLLDRVDTLQQQDSVVSALNKLARTFTAQVEALKRYRTGGEQKVTVQHVSVSEGGQAIVGNVTQAKGEIAPKKLANITPALTDARKPAFTIDDKPDHAPVRRRQKDGGRSSA